MTDSTTSSSPGGSTCAEEDLQGKSLQLTIVLSVYGTVGFVGNMLIFIVYSREKGKMSHAVYIYTLAIVDLTVCSVIIPYTIFFERQSITSDVVCRGLELFRHTLVMVSNMLLLAIAVERYMSVFKPWRPGTQRKAKKIIAAIFVSCAVCGTPAVTIFTVTTKPNNVTSAPTGSNVTSCAAHAYCQFTTMGLFGEMWARLYQGFLALEFFAAVTVIAILYINVYRKIWARVQWRKKLAPQAARTSALHPNGTGTASHSRNDNTSSHFPIKANKSKHAWSTSESRLYPSIVNDLQNSNEIRAVREIGVAPAFEKDGQNHHEIETAKEPVSGAPVDTVTHHMREEDEDSSSSTDSVLEDIAETSGAVFLTVPVKSSKRLRSAKIRQSVPLNEHPVRVVIEPEADNHSNTVTAAANVSKTTATATTNGNSNQQSNNNNEPSRHDNRKKAGTMLFICTLIYVLTWLPFWVDIFGATDNLVFRYTFLLGHVTNPLVYGALNAKVREEIKRLLLCRR
ncbi:cholecystokinin receptor type A-like [Littorina saxatilis]|uniref:G-protein coupled receptors family 1 profile domain-containing protein n=1 Tax=Littorina saxatilis TaxID=31220 RepID=A0AAN9AWW1_9CAEN